MSNIERLHINGWNTKYNIYTNLKAPQKYIIPPHWHDFYELEIVLAGEGIASVNGKVYPMSKGSLFFITPTDFHSFTSYDSTMEILNLGFASSCIEASNFSDMLSFSERIICNVDDKELAYFKYMIMLIEEEMNNDKYLSKQYTSQILLCILITLFRLGRNTDTIQNVNSSVQRILHYIHTHFKEQISLEDVAKYTEYSEGHICRLLKQSLGCTFKEYLTNLRMTHAEQMLMCSSESISDIAYFCGFSSLSHFINVFKKKHRISPRQYRKENQT